LNSEVKYQRALELELLLEALREAVAQKKDMLQSVSALTRAEWEQNVTTLKDRVSKVLHK
jgi:hypothetical protein